MKKISDESFVRCIVSLLRTDDWTSTALAELTGLDHAAVRSRIARLRRGGVQIPPLRGADKPVAPHFEQFSIMYWDGDRWRTGVVEAIEKRGKHRGWYRVKSAGQRAKLLNPEKRDRNGQPLFKVIK